LRAGEIYLRKNEQRRAVSNFESALPILQRLVDVSPDYEARRSDLAAVQNHLESLKTGYLAKIHGKR
jgi:hypothetical protein